ncbi:MAG: hypothetical protein GC190_21005 [Alphaproteobacteria bacterium]|nr:hypothetical protein [Alphaproteobacteria bacterium]
MRNVCILAFLIGGLWTASALAADLTPIQDSPANGCKDTGCSYWEWRVNDAPNIRIVSSGYEDGITDTFERVDQAGKYATLLAFRISVEPRIGGDTNERDRIASFPHRMGPKGLEVWATFDHHFVFDGEHCFPKWQHRIPAVLFLPDGGRISTKLSHKYRRIPLVDLIKRSRIAVPGSNATVARMACR